MKTRGVLGRVLRSVWRAGTGAALTALAGAPLAAIAAGAPIDFNRDIRPIFAQNCYTCHGPDANHRKAGLRLDAAEGPFRKDKNGKWIIARGQRAESELYRRIRSTDPDYHMPAIKPFRSLSPDQIQLIGQWIDQGAPWTPHWSFVPPRRPAIPQVKNKAWPRNPIDNFVLARLEKAGLPPNPEADKRTLIRRVNLDLTGLPPSVEEVDAFLADKSPGAYEKVVDRLLDSAQYGEQMARYWLDAARYADTHGFHIDAERSIWPYRDWVIRAFNQNMPFDQFTIKQIAGDLLPKPTLDDLVATGFNRCNMTTGEGGAIPQEYLTKYAIDRANTTATVWLGLTVGCAQCHNHKFDPISQKEYYQMYAFFNNVAENGLDGNAPNPPPFIKVPSPEQAAEQKKLQEQIGTVQARLDGPLPEVDRAQSQWQEHWASKLDPQWQTLDPSSFQSDGGATLRKLDDKSILAGGKNPDSDVYEVVARTDASEITALRLEALTDESLPRHGAGRADNANFVLSEIEAEVSPLAHPDQKQKINFAAAFADYSQPKYEAAKAIDGKLDTGWAADGNLRRENRTAVFVASAPARVTGGMELRVRLHFKANPKHAIGRFRLSTTSNANLLQLAAARFSPWRSIGPFHPPAGQSPFDAAFPPEKEIRLDGTYDRGQLKWVKRPKFADGKPHDLTGENAATYLYRTIESPSARRITFSLGSDDALKVWLNKKVVFEKNVTRAIAPDQDKVTVQLEPGANELLMKVVNFTGGYAFYFNKEKEDTGGLPIEIAQVFARVGAHLTLADEKELRDYYRKTHSPEWRKLADELQQLQEKEKALDDEIPTTMVMRERTPRRRAYRLNRGEYDHPAEEVFPGVPAFLPPLPAGAPTNRLGLALWLVAPSNPLTARVTVNRFWSHFFGAGLVRTVEDFGTQGELPSHPQLLDWLATEFIRSGWNVKALNRLIVTSAAYRESSRLTPLLEQQDPENRLLARGPRYRMDAEMIRDNALAIAGLLQEKIGGHSVKPYQPRGLWSAVSYGYKQHYVQDHGANLYRRSLYTFWKRQSPPPSMIVLDAPSRETCAVRRPRTNTPLQALLLMDGPQFVEAARVFAERLMTEAQPDPAAKIRYAFELALARPADPEETKILLDKYRAHLRHYEKDPEAARQLIRVGDSKPVPGLDPRQLAAWTTVASMILNLDETISKS